MPNMLLHTYILLRPCSVEVLFRIRGEQVHIRNDVEQTLVERGINASSGLRGEGSGRSSGGKDKGDRGLHFGCLILMCCVKSSDKVVTRVRFSRKR